MPVIHTHVSVPTTPEQREALKAAYGKAITAVPGKSEGWLMCPFEDNMPIYFGGGGVTDVGAVLGNTERGVQRGHNALGQLFPSRARHRAAEHVDFHIGGGLVIATTEVNRHIVLERAH